MAEQWKTIARADSVNDLKNANPTVTDLNAGTVGRVTIEGLPLFTAKFFDLPWAEQTLGNHIVPAHAKVLDCYEKGGTAYVDFEVTGSPVLPLIAAIAIALAVIGVAAALITVAIKAPGALMDGIKVAGLIALVGGGYLLVKGR